MSELHALILDDDDAFRAELAALVAGEGFAVSEAGSVERAREVLEGGPVDVALVDHRLPDGDGLELMRSLDEEGGIEVVIVTDDADLESAVGALRLGALDYLTRPVDRARLRGALANVSRTRALKGEVSTLRRELRELGRFGPIVGRSAPMQRVYDLIAKVAPTGAAVLVVGESGTGKELVAETIHALSRRKDRALVAVHCGAIPETLIESELFGHEKGAFTGAERRHVGVFERADGGTLFLDEITEMPVEVQVKLLRVLETGRLRRLGGARAESIDVRIVSACNRDPALAIEDGSLREDLYYRLAVFPIELPPLREREDDVELVAEHLLALQNREAGTQKRWTRAALARLRRRRWAGNVRELRNVVERAYILAEDEIPASAVEEEGIGDEGAPAGGKVVVPVGASIAEAEQLLIEATLEHTQGDKRAAARLLGIGLKTLYSRLKVYEAARAAAAGSGASAGADRK